MRVVTTSKPNARSKPALATPCFAHELPAIHNNHHPNAHLQEQHKILACDPSPLRQCGGEHVRGRHPDACK